MNRRKFLLGIGAFMILPSAGRIWKASRPSLWIWSERHSYCYDKPALDKILEYLNSLKSNRQNEEIIDIYTDRPTANRMLHFALRTGRHEDERGAARMGASC